MDEKKVNYKEYDVSEKEFGGKGKWDDLENDFVIVACASIHNLDIVVSVYLREDAPVFVFHKSNMARGIFKRKGQEDSLVLPGQALVPMVQLALLEILVLAMAVAAAWGRQEAASKEETAAQAAAAKSGYGRGDYDEKNAV